MKSFLTCLAFLFVTHGVWGQTNCASKIVPLATGETWVLNPGCPGRTWYNIPNVADGAIRCHCWSFCGYICGPNPFAATSTTTPSSTMTSSTTPSSTTPSSTTPSSTTSSSTTPSSTTTAPSDHCPMGPYFFPRPTLLCICTPSTGAYSCTVTPARR
ncbi:endo-1,3(4)-beta-glucanase 1 [Folsomia candida]|uniref:Uncharacterized protein n=1 Tax=Folsomia candida TaxID=158441 RepID=A0A226DS24_FOLCA|nr:endo-1,3(4)-beta-glucanase 1 [Folsomia candida]OXA48302.1 hypothetical protein Fcan01_16980 [Folsomia candida]